MQEIERKFVLPFAAIEAELSAPIAIRQGYCMVTDEGVCRIRQQGDEYSLAMKRKQGMVRNEYETYLLEAQFEVLWPMTHGARIEKERYDVVFAEGHTIVDCFGGALTGLTMLEIEFSEELAAKSFIPPKWFGQEVTADFRFFNHNLCKMFKIPSLSDSQSL